MLSVALIILLVIFIVLVLASAWFGAFNRVNVSVKETGGETLVYEAVKGDYKNTGTFTNKIYYLLLNEDNVETYKGFGIFYDNPKKTEKSQLKSEVGCILEPADSAKAAQLETKYSVKQYDRKEYIVAEFPFKGTPSIVIGLFKVYPAINQFAQQNGFEEDTPVMEIYDVPGKKIEYRKAIVRKNNLL